MTRGDACRTWSRCVRDEDRERERSGIRAGKVVHEAASAAGAGVSIDSEIGLPERV